MIKLTLIIFGILLITSCNMHIEKRLYNKGFHVEYLNKKNIKSEKITCSITCANLADKNKVHTGDKQVALNNNINYPETNEQAQVDDDKMVSFITPFEPVILIKANNFKKSTKTQTPVLKTEKANTKGKKQNSKNLDGYLYLLAALMGGTVFGLFRMSQKKGLKVARWANSNKLKTKFLIGLIQIGLGTLGVMIGKAFFELGFNFSNNLEYISGGVMALGFLNLLINTRKEIILLPRTFYFKKMSHLVIAMSFFVLTTAIGNKLGDDRKQISPLGYMVEKTDQAVSLNSNSASGLQPSSSTSDSNETKKWRGMLALFIILYILLAAALLALTCFLFCSGYFAGAIPLLIFTLALLVVLPWLMARWVKKCKLESVN